jgi:renalase
MRTTRTADASTSEGLEPPRIAVIGAGVAGAACAAGLLRAGFDVTAFDKSRGVGGRLATRRAEWADADGVAHAAAFDHGCAQFTASRPRFRAVVDRVVALGGATRWRQRVHARFPDAGMRDVVVPTPDMPAFCRHLLNGVPLRLGHAVSALQRGPGGWMLHLADGRVDGPFERVVLAIPAAQAATLIRAHQREWAAALDSVRMSPCWTLMALTDNVDWPWDAAEIERGELAWIARIDRVPGRAPASAVPWVAHATPAWSLAHLDDDPAHVGAVLRAALGRLLARGGPPRWHHAVAHRWRHAQCVQAVHGGTDHWCNNDAGLGVCGDAFGDGSVESAWCSGDALASALMGSLHTTLPTAPAPRAKLAEPPLAAHHRRLGSLLPLSETSVADSAWEPFDERFQ